MKTIQFILLLTLTLVSLNSESNTQMLTQNYNTDPNRQLAPTNYSPSLCGHTPLNGSKNLYKIKNIKKHCGCFPDEAICVARVRVL